MDLRPGGKRVLVTGASEGMGLPAALGLAAEGCVLGIVARSESTLEVVAKDGEAAVPPASRCSPLISPRRAPPRA